jgi:phospholipase C
LEAAFMSSLTRSLFALLVAACWAAAGLTAASAAGLPATSSQYDHIFVIVEENHGFTDVIGNPAAPNLNALASAYGVATHYFAVTHPSEPNYVALLGGSPFTVNSDNPYYVQQVARPSLISELDHAHVSWKAYLQGMPHAGYQGICYPANCNGEPDKDPLYVSKHVGISNYTTSLNRADWSRQVPIGQLAGDLRTGHVPAFNWVIPDECHDQHGDPPYCIDSGSPGDPQDQRLVAFGDAYLGQLVEQITSAKFWAKGNNAIDIVYDEGDNNAHGGGRVSNVVVTSHGPRHLKAPAFYSHYSLLRTIQDNFGVPCLQHSCDVTTKPMTPLFAVTGSAAMAFKAMPMPNLAAPSPTPKEPVHFTTDTSSGAGWTVQRAPALGTNDNSLGAVSAASKHDVWAVGNFLPDTKSSNQDATLAKAVHFNGTKWVSTRVPDAGPNYNTLFGVAATAHRAWAVGVRLNKGYFARGLIEAWTGKAWHIARSPRVNGLRDVLFSAAATSASDVWAVGERQDRQDVFHTLVEHWNGSNWSVVPSPDPGSTGNCLFGVAAAGPNDVWVVGQSSGRHTDVPLAEHWDGRRWAVAHLPTAGLTGSLLQSVAIDGRDVWAVGQSDDAAHQARPLVEHLESGKWSAETPAHIGTGFSDIAGVAVDHGTAWLVGSALDTAGDQLTVVARNSGSGWKQVSAPNPGSGDRILGGISAAGGSIWAVGAYDTDSGRAPLIEVHGG